MRVCQGSMFSVGSTSSNFSADAVGDALQALVKDMEVLVFSGFSGSGYADEGGVKRLMRAALDEQSDKHGAHNVVVVAGATDEGIGKVYKVAHELGMKTLGIVSEQARQYGHSQYCEEVVYVEDSGKSWKVLSPEDFSYMVTVSQMGKGGTLFFIGGGAVACSELEEALARGVKVQIHKDFLPRSSEGPTPLRDWCNANPVACQSANAWHSQTVG